MLQQALCNMIDEPTSRASDQVKTFSHLERTLTSMGIGLAFVISHAYSYGLLGIEAP